MSFSTPAAPIPYTAVHGRGEKAIRKRSFPPPLLGQTGLRGCGPLQSLGDSGAPVTVPPRPFPNARIQSRPESTGFVYISIGHSTQVKHVVRCLSGTFQIWFSASSVVDFQRWKKTSHASHSFPLKDNYVFRKEQCQVLLQQGQGR